MMIGLPCSFLYHLSYLSFTPSKNTSHINKTAALYSINTSSFIDVMRNPEQNFLNALSTHLGPHELAVADDRAKWFEVILDAHAEFLYSKQKKKSEPLTSNDYLMESVSPDRSEISQMRLHALKQRIAQTQRQQAKEVAEEEKRKQFIKGLLG